MEVIKVLDDLYKFNHSIPNVPINFNQFLFLGNDPMLIHTGNHNMAKDLVPKLKEILGEKKLSYIFVSHFEGDECGGIDLILEQYPDAHTICSKTTSMQFNGFGFNYDLLIKNPDDTLEKDVYSLKFISYPSEMHLWEGLIVFDTKRNILFSSDLIINYDNIDEQIIDSTIEEEINAITERQIPSPKALEIIKHVLSELPIKYIASGHGPFIKLHN
ncbi:MBL fold metallo-hydrolase [Clostridium sp. YIM B02551]|uniref:MBL fold metallo-hydrolase n=1 Tax=Clostridium sp. YIM B02551 TaxID=2910679 RepID=UPI001EEB583B|nr:MBL fold metallo-hydrolase [Clostridium sp. YIM B02551]